MNQRAKPYVVWNIRTNLRYNIYFNGFIFCEFLNFAIVLLQFLVTNQFLSRRFLLYGLEVIRVDNFKKYIYYIQYSLPYVVTLQWCYQCVAQMLLLLGLAILPPTLRGTAPSFCQESHVHYFPTDRLVSITKWSLWITT